MADTTNSLRDALFRVEPTRGLVEYTQVVKPYHTKLMEVLVEYIYEELVDVTVNERWTWMIELNQPETDVTYACGYGITWDNASSADANPLVMINDVVPGHHNVLGASPTAGLTPATFTFAGNVLSSFPIGSTFKVTDSPYSYSAYTVPPNIFEFTVGPAGPTYVNGHTVVPITETLLAIPAGIDVLGRGYARTDEPISVANSFLVSATAPYVFDFTATNINSNQFALIDRVTIINVNAAARRWTLSGDHVADIDVGSKLYVTSNTGGANGTYTVQSRVLNGANTDVVVEEPVFGSATPDGFAGIPLKSSDTYTIVGINAPSRILLVSGIHTTGILPGQDLVITGNTGGADGTYYVQSVLAIGNNTQITVKNSINPAATATGTVTLERLPKWVSGTKISLSGTGIQPVPLNTITEYHFIPTATPGVFNLAYSRYPQELKDYVNITSLGSGVLKINRAELYYPGAIIRVDNTFNSSNNGVYFVKETHNEGSYTRITTMQSIKSPHGGTSSIAGTITAVGSGYDEPSYCPIASAGGLYTDTFIHETLQFTITMMPRDKIQSDFIENNSYSGGYGVARYSEFMYGPYGDGLSYPDVPSRFVVTSGLPPSDGGGTLLPMGYDVQLWDMGGMGENLDDVQNFYGQSFP